MAKSDLSLAEFYLENGNHIKFYHDADVMHLIESYEDAVKNQWHFYIGNWGDNIKELYYNGKIIKESNFSFPTTKVDLHKFEG